MQKHASGMTFQHCVQPQHCVKVVEPHENNLEVLNAFAWAPSRQANSFGNTWRSVWSSAGQC